MYPTQRRVFPLHVRVAGDDRLCAPKGRACFCPGVINVNGMPSRLITNTSRGFFGNVNDLG